jgi:hypothetical protein
MRVFAAATILLLLSSVAPGLAEEAGNAAGSNPPLTVPVQPERTPQQSEESRGHDPQRADDLKIGRDWRAEERRFDRSQTNETGRMTDEQDRDHPAVGRGRHMDRDDDERGYRDDDRPRRRIKICFEYENGDEYCRYRR